MERPEKKICSTCNGTQEITDISGDTVICPRCCIIHQYNVACTDWESYLKEQMPSEVEIRKIMVGCVCLHEVDTNKAATAIHELYAKRLGS